MRLSRNVRRFSQPLSITNCTDKLIQNDPGFVELSLERLGENFDLDEFVYAIGVNRTVRHVCFSGTFVRELEEGQWRTMLEAIGRLEALEELQVWCSTIPVDVFAHTLHNAFRLRKVYFFRVGLSGDQAAFDQLSDSIRVHPSLRDIRIGGFHLVSPDLVNLDSVVIAMGEAPRLEVISLQLSGAQAAVPFSAEAMERIFSSPTVMDLYLSRLGLGQEHVKVIARSLCTNKTLKVLDLFGNNLENEHIILMANALKENTALETLVLPCPSEDLSVESCAAISQGLQHNSTLITLNLPRSNLCDQGLYHLSQGLTVNTTLRKIEVGVKKDVGDEGIHALTDMLEKNYELERLVVSSPQKSIREKVEYYMRLNEVGRGSLLRDGKATREQWVEMLISVSNDLDCLFYFTTMNPALCQFVNAHRADVIITEEFRVRRRHTINLYSNDDHPVKRVENRRASAF